jgi:DNA polymerase III delta prime subunit
LDRARWLDETKHYKQDEICRKIKNELRKEIVQRNISERCIEGCLSSKYKRKYIRSEVSSVSSPDYQNDVHELIDAFDKLQLRDQINKLSDEFDCMLDIISNARKEKQKELFLASRSFLERIIDSANHRIAVSAPLQFSTHFQRDRQ